MENCRFAREDREVKFLIVNRLFEARPPAWEPLEGLFVVRLCRGS